MVYGVQITEDEGRAKIFVTQLECDPATPKDKRVYVRCREHNVSVIARSDGDFAEKLANAVDQGLTGSMPPGMHSL